MKYFSWTSVLLFYCWRLILLLRLFAANKSAVYNSTTDTWLFSVEEICLEQNVDQETFVGE